MLKPPKTSFLRPGQDGVVAAPKVPGATEAEAETSVSRGCLLRQQ